MRRIVAIALASAGMLGAQNPPPRAEPGIPGGARGAQSLLARSAELDLTDAQVVKLAAIARRAETRQRALRATMDSGRARLTQPGDSAARRQFAERMRTTMERERDQARVDLRDAIATLTADQQARAWELNARRGAMGGGARRGGGMGGRPGRGGMGMGGPGRGPRSMPEGPRRPRDEFGPGGGDRMRREREMMPRMRRPDY